MEDPYVYEGTNVLINLANIKGQDKLDNFETTLSRVAIVELLKNPIDITSTKDILHYKRVFYECEEKTIIKLIKNDSYLSAKKDSKILNKPSRSIQRTIVKLKEE